MENSIVRIIIVDDHDIFREGVKAVLKTIENTQVVAEASNGKEFLEILEHKECDLVFMDIQMPIMDGIDATKLAMEMKPALKIVALSMFGEEKYLQSMLDAGAAGFLLKKIKRAELDIAIKNVMQGNNFFSQELLSFFTNKYLAKGNDTPAKFTARELEILQLLSKGYNSGEIAVKFNISSRTVDNHRASLLAKTGSKNVLEMLIYAVVNKLVQL